MGAKLRHGSLPCVTGLLPVRLKGWSFREMWVRLSGPTLTFHEDEETERSAELDMLGGRVKVHRRGGKWQLRVQTVTGQHALLLVDDEDDMMRWRTELQNASQRRVENDYTFGKVIGCGSYSQVVRAVERSDENPREVAVKIIDKLRCSPTDLIFAHREVSLMVHVVEPHPNIIRTLDVYESTEFFYLVLEYAEGGTLRDFLDRSLAAAVKGGAKGTPSGGLPEHVAASVTRSLARAIGTLHAMNIVHRDVKLENVMMMRDDTHKRLRLGDLGYATQVDSFGGLTAMVGTPGYFPPEMIAREPYSFAVDLWALGVCLYQLLTGDFPFGQRVMKATQNNGDRSAAEILRQVRDGRFHKDTPGWKNLSADARSVIGGLLQVNPTKRLCAIGVLCHPFVTGVRAYEGKLHDATPRRRLKRTLIAARWAARLRLMRFADPCTTVSEESRKPRLSTLSQTPNNRKMLLRRLSVAGGIASRYLGSPVSSGEEPGHRVREERSDSDLSYEDLSSLSTRISQEGVLGLRRSLGSVRETKQRTWSPTSVRSGGGGAAAPPDDSDERGSVSGMKALRRKLTGSARLNELMDLH